MTERRIGRYRVEKKLGEGGVGEVFKAVDPMLDRPVALKRLRPELASRPQIVDRFRSEARTLAQLNHPNIATLYSFEQDGKSLLMVMEYVEGETLSTLLRRDGAFPLERAIPLLVQALHGIGYAHARGVIHRDLKGPNLMLRNDGVLKVMDFGIARMIGSERVTQLGQLVGTPEFMSPEQIQGADTDARSDIYSLGILSYALLTGRVPFREKSGFDLMKAQIEAPPPPVSHSTPNVPEILDAIVARALAKDPAKRFESADAFRAALEPLLARRRSETERRGSPREPSSSSREPAPETGGAARDTARDEPTQDMLEATDHPTILLGDEVSEDAAIGVDPEAFSIDDAPTQISPPGAIATAARLADEAERIPRAQQLAWILAPSLIATLWMGLGVILSQLSSGPGGEKPIVAERLAEPGNAEASASAARDSNPQVNDRASELILFSVDRIDGADPNGGNETLADESGAAGPADPVFESAAAAAAEKTARGAVAMAESTATKPVAKSKPPARAKPKSTAKAKVKVKSKPTRSTAARGTTRTAAPPAKPAPTAQEPTQLEGSEPEGKSTWIIRRR